MLLLVSAGCGFTAVPARGSQLRCGAPVMVTVDVSAEDTTPASSPLSLANLKSRAGSVKSTVLDLAHATKGSLGKVFTNENDAVIAAVDRVSLISLTTLVKYATVFPTVHKLTLLATLLFPAGRQALDDGAVKTEADAEKTASAALASWERKGAEMCDAQSQVTWNPAEASAQAQKWLDECVIVDDGTARAEDYAVAQASAVAQVRVALDAQAETEKVTKSLKAAQSATSAARTAVAKARAAERTLLNEQREALATLAAARRAELGEKMRAARLRGKAARAQKKMRDLP